MKKFDEIIKTMKKYRGKPLYEPITQGEGLLCMVAYFSQPRKLTFSERWKRFKNLLTRKAL